MKRLTPLVLAVLALIIIGSFLYTQNSVESMLSVFRPSLSSDNDDVEEDEDQSQSTANLTVTISKETQQFAGIKTSLAKNISVRAEDNAFASVIDIQDLLTLRSNYREVKAHREIIHVAVNNTKKSLAQLELLNREANNISTQKLQQAEASWQAENARINAVNIQLQNIRNNMIQKWDTEITTLALKENSEVFERLINRKEYLILVSLKAAQQLNLDTAFIFVNREDNRHQARKAYFISAAPFSDNTLQGETYFFRTNSNKIRIGMRLYVWLPNTGFTGKGVNIPAEAVVWHSGKSWAYVQTSANSFSRRGLLDPIQSSTGWLVKENFKVGDKVVISGAQTLLSEEFRHVIPDEDDD